MLLEFRFANYKCFKDEQVFSLVASADRSHSDNLAELSEPKKLRLAKSAVVYGANASGKTTLLDALHFFTNFVRTSANKEPDHEIDVAPFLLDSEAAKSPSSFEATFVAENEVLYRYGFVLDRTRVHEEWLTSYPKGRPRKLFRRFIAANGVENFEFSPYLGGEKEKLKELTRPNALFLSVGATFNHQRLLHAYRWLAKQVRGLQADRMRQQMVTPVIEKEGELFRQVAELLKYADLGVVDFEVTERGFTPEKLPEEMPEELRGALRAFFDHLPADQQRVIDVKVIHQGSTEKVAFDLDDESAGTQQLFALSFPVLSALTRGGVIFADELDSSLHPLLVQALVRLFHNPLTNPKNAQLIFNTHDTTLLSSSLFRRDQIWLVEKGIDGASHVYSLLEYSPRKGEALERGYLQGRYGAIPFLSEPIAGVISGG